MAIIKNIDYKLGAFTLSLSKLEVPDKGVTAFIGPSGSGKSTFFNILIGLYQPKAWSWDYQQLDLARMSVSQRRFGVVFQSDDLFPHMTAEENIKITFAARNKNADFESTVAPIREKLKLETCWRTKAYDLSGGEKQRVSLLRALVTNPRMLLLDEPFSSLDTASKVESRALVKSLLEKLSIPVYLITHDPEDVRILANHIVEIVNGRFSSVKRVDT